MEQFKTIMQDAQAEIEEKKSRFIANVYYIEKTEEAEEHLKHIRKKYFNARHNCFAYRILEENGVKEKQSDDGEPSGTAGAPMLNILQKNNLYNVLVVVTRYFGGTLLGTGGLVRAYSDATIKSLENAKVIIQTKGYLINVVIEYKNLEKFKYYCRMHGIIIVNTVYENNIICTIEISKNEKENLLGKEQKEITILGNTVIREKYIRINIEE